MPSKRERFGLDSSCIIALLCDWHVNHQTTLHCYQHFLSNGAAPVIPVHAILESFSVLTRLPAARRIAPEVASQMLKQSFAGTAILAGLNPETVWRTIDALARQGLGGGRVYDAVIAMEVAEADAPILLTWNVRDFIPIAPATLEIRQPSSTAN
jgi:predicted nucleic acid-binding protein